MGYGEWVDALLDESEDDVLSEATDLGRSYHYLQIHIPTIVTGDVGFEVCETLGGTYKTLGTGSAIIEAGTGDLTTTVELGGYRFIKVSTAGTQTSDITFRVRGSNV